MIDVELNPTANLAGDVAIVTGASSGLGERFAQVLAAHGAQVVLVGRRLGRLQALAEALEAQFDTAAAAASARYA